MGVVVAECTSSRWPCPSLSSAWAGAVMSGCLAVLVLAPAQIQAAPQASPMATVPVEIHSSLVMAAPLPERWTVVLTPWRGEESSEGLLPEEAERFSILGDTPLELRLPVGSRWVVTAELPGFWVRRQTLIAETSGGGSDSRTSGGGALRLTLSLWPLGEVRGQLRVAVSSGPTPALPRQLWVKTVPLPSFLKARKTPPGTIPCPVAVDGAFRCTIPVGTFDLAITAPVEAGLTPAYFWGVKVPVSELPDRGTSPMADSDTSSAEARSGSSGATLGTVTLRRGSSMAAWVAVEGGKIDPEGCVARLTPLACAADPDTRIETSRMATEVQVGGDGFVQFTGLTPGLYELAVQQPGYAPARALAVQVQPGRETFVVEPLVLRQPVDLLLQVRPELDPWGQPWGVQLLFPKDGTARSHQQAFLGSADQGGLLTAARQAAGQYVVALEDSRGNLVFWEEKLLDDSGIATIEIPRLWVEGDLRLGEEPLSGKLAFSYAQGRGKVLMRADGAGHFEGFLTGEGFWAVRIEAGEQQISSERLVEIEDEGDGTAYLDLELPDNEIHGRVVDDQGRPVPGSWVVARAGSEVVASDNTDSGGRFRLRALPPGKLSLAAEAEGLGVAGPLSLSLADDGEEGPFELRLRPLRQITGMVLFEGNPVLGARVVLIARPPAQGVAEASTGSAGTFTLQLPAEVSAVVAVAGGGSFALRGVPLSLNGEPLTLRLTQHAGELEIVLPFSEREGFRRGLRPALFQHGVEVTTPLLDRDGRRLVLATEDRTVSTVPNLAPGEYTFCLLPTGEGSPGAGPRGGGACDSGWLAAGGGLVLQPEVPD